MTEFEPLFLYPPSDTLLELLEERNITPAELAALVGMPLLELTAILNGVSPITPAWAAALAAHHYGNERYWLTYEQRYQEAKAQREKMATPAM